MKILITGGSGLVGSNVVRALEKQPDTTVLACDIREPVEPFTSATFIKGDVREPEMYNAIIEHKPDIVVHLAAIVVPGGNRELEYSVDVGGTENVIKGCIDAGVRRLIVSSSGAAYGYHADNPEWLTEEDPVRGNYEMPYSHHKRLVEEMLADLRKSHPQIEQTIFRMGTILGPGLQNAITNLFDKPKLPMMKGSPNAFVFTWIDDLAKIFVQACTSDVTGIFNVAGDGAVSMEEAAKIMGKPVTKIPPGLARFALSILKPLKLSMYGPEQVLFLQYRPVLLNTKLKEEFGFTPELSSEGAFRKFLESRKQGA